jgi:uncharacterized protein (TIGR00255 family)
MILSMTGFGEAQLEADGSVLHLELRSVNSRYFKATTHLPEEYAFLEPELERRLRQSITRGSLIIRMYVRSTSAEAAEEVNVAAIRQYVDQLRAAAGDDARLTIDLATLATLPGVCQPHELTEQQREQRWGLAQRLLDAALEKLVAMRSADGRLLAEDLRTHAALVAARLAEIRQRIPAVVEEYRQRLAARINELIANSNVRLAEDDLLKEVAIYAERSDISEEVSRLAGHMGHFEGCMNSGEPAGRKLEFIAQEMLREANTIGSKASDTQIARAIIDIKSAIDRIKEQVQNAE